MADKVLPRAEYIASLPKKYSSGGVIFTNDKNEILLLKVSYKEHWEIPGGIVEKDESPQQACIREAQEELGITIELPQFLGVAFKFVPEVQEESYQFYFFGGVLTEESIAAIQLQPEEATEYKFVHVDELEKYVWDSFLVRIKLAHEAITTGKPFYIEIGK